MHNVENLIDTSDRQTIYTALWRDGLYFSIDLVDKSQAEWDSHYSNNFPGLADLTDYEFMMLLRRQIALLNNSHSRIPQPSWNSVRMDFPKAGFKKIEGKIVVENCSEKNNTVLPIGSIVEKISDMDTEEYIQTKIAPFHSLDRPENVYTICERYLFEGETNQQHNLTIRLPDGKRRSVSLTCDKRVDLSNWQKPVKKLPRVEKLDDDVVFFSIPHFGDSATDVFGEHVEAFTSARRIILDLRECQGGNDISALQIAQHFLEEPVELPNGRIRVVNFHTGSDWMYPDGVVIIPAVPGIRGDLHILVSGKTASMAEDFISLLRKGRQVTLIGETTAGGTGSSHVFQHAHNIAYQICYQDFSYMPDNFCGTGIKPDVEKSQTYDDFLQDRDTVKSFVLKNEQHG